MWGAQGTWSQWPLQPSMFKNVPHNEIDWAALAKQWIQMQNPETDAISAIIAQPEVTSLPPPPPSHEDFTRDDVSHHMPFSTDRQFSSDPNEILNPPGVGPDPISNFEAQNSAGYWARPKWESAAPVDDRAWPPIAPSPPVLPVIAPEKKTFDYGHIHDNPAITMQTVDYNHVGPDPYYPTENQIYVPPPPPQDDPYDQYWSQVGSVGSTPVMPSTFLKKERINDYSTEEDTSHIDAAKRKQLPAWIREGLEKMEQERLKRLEKERAEKEQAERAKKVSEDPLKKGLLGDSSVATKSKFDSDSENEIEEVAPPSKVLSPHVEAKPHFSPPPEEIISEEERRQQLVLKVRRFLTEILLSVTNSEMAAIAKEVHLKALAKAPARPLATTSALRSLATGLHSLASYESHSDKSDSESEGSDSSTSDEELRRRIQEKRRKFASKERKILAELEEAETREQRKSQSQDTRNIDSSHDSSKNRNSYSEKPESEVDPNIIRNLNAQSSNFGSDDRSSTNSVSNLESDSNKPLEIMQEIVDENGDSKSRTKNKEESISNDSESDSFSSSSSTDKSSARKRKSSTKEDYKSKKQSRSPKHKRKSSRQNEDDKIHNSRSNSSKKKHRSRSKKHSREKYDRRSDSSQSSRSSNSQIRMKEYRSSERSQRRSGSSDYPSRYRSSSPSKHRKSRSRSRSRRESHFEKHKSSRYYDELHSKKERKRSRSRSSSYIPKHYRRKSRSVSEERSRHYKKSKIASRDR